MLNGSVSDEEEEEDEAQPTKTVPTVPDTIPIKTDSGLAKTTGYCETQSSDNSAVIKSQSESAQDDETFAKKRALSLEVQEISRGSMVEGDDEVDKSVMIRPDPEGQNSSSPSSPGNTSDIDKTASSMTAGHEKTGDSCNSCHITPRMADLAKSPAFLKLKAELDTAREQLQSKEQQVDKLSKIRDEVETEVQELTASLFQEAHKMVGDANEKRVSTEKCLAEANMKIDGLETEVTALKALVLTSTPSQPNRHLHPQLAKNSSPNSRSKGGKDGHRRQGSDGSGSGIKDKVLGPGKRLSFSLNASPRSNKSVSPTCHNPPPASTYLGPLANVVVGAGGLPGEDGSQDTSDQEHTQVCEMGADCDNSCGFYDRQILIDPTLRQEYLAWKKAPTLDRSETTSSSSQFLRRIYQEDIDPCLDFPAPATGSQSQGTGSESDSQDTSSQGTSEGSSSPSVSSEKEDIRELVIRCIHDQTICIAPLKNEEVVKGCPLLGSDRVLCKYMVKCHVQEQHKEFRISQLARNRITAVCNLLNYLDYIKKGLVKSHHNEVYKEILQLRRHIVLAKLGFSPD